MSILVDFDGLKRLGKEFLDALPGATEEEADAGFHCFALAYLNCDLKNQSEEIQAPILMKIIADKFMESGKAYMGWQSPPTTNR